MAPRTKEALEVFFQKSRERQEKKRKKEKELSAQLKKLAKK